MDTRFRAWDSIYNKYLMDGAGFSLHGESFFLYGFGHLDEDGERSCVDFVNDINFEQCTNIKDNSGVLIYVGDILQESAPRGNKYKVFNVVGGIGINEHQDDLSKPPEKIMFYSALADMQNMAYITQGCKVIGNVNQNEELLEVNKEQS